jgi:endonuclease/exonuclease/phosphatase family metal-dependent hydrolase
LPHPRLVAALAATLTVAVAAPAAEAAPSVKPPPAKLKVMTRNIYLGGNIFLPLSAKTRPEFERLAGELWGQVISTNFPARAKLLAREIKRHKPDLIGLQEVALWRRGPTGVKDGATTRATQVVYDFKKTLLAELKRAGLKYRVGDTQREADIEASIDQGFDVRLTMSDVILVKRRKGLKVRKRSSKNFKASITVPTSGGPFTSRRGWTAVDASLDGRKFRFLNTHLEAALADTRQAQARELIAKGGPARKKGRLILVGDLNSDRDGLDNGDPVPYRDLARFGFKDAWVAGGGKGFSCCFNSPLIREAPPAPFDHRIDHILVKPRTKASKARVVGNDPKIRAGTLWPSDHGGAVVTFSLK